MGQIKITSGDVDRDGNVLLGKVMEALFVDKGLDRREYPIKMHNDTLIWLDKDNPMLEISNPTDITAKEISTKRAEMKTAYAAEVWRRNRVLEYPPPGAQLEKIYDDGVDKWKSEMVDPIKTKWPKNNSGPVE